MRPSTRLICLAMIGLGMALATDSVATAQYPVYEVQPVAPAVVGYTAEQRGWLGRRVVLRPVVAPIPVAPVPVAAVGPVAPVAVARPVVPAPVVPAPVMPAPVASYYPPSVPVPVAVPQPVTTFRVPLVPYVPVYGF